MKFIYAEYNMYHNSIDVTTFDGYILRIDCNVAEDGLRTTPGSQCALNSLAIDEPLEYARLALDGNLQMRVDAEDSLELWQED
ncbi:MAG TPA: toxin-antitoxin system protein [Lachnospiraceae bacterium]|nr:toxin-antitoxin system protein [Lachnospiraceae bacterium]